MEQSRILVVEDEPRMAEILTDYLRQAGFRCEWHGNGKAALEEVRRAPPELLLLDVMLPGMDGLTVCREIRKFSQLPIIMVSARVEELDRLLGLELGADDYVCKPFSPREVVARAKAVLRRSGQRAEADEPPLWQIDEAARRIAVAGRSLELTRTEYRLLHLLSARPGRIYTRAQILDLAYGDEPEVSDRVIDSHIKNIRRKLAEALPGRELIHAVYGVGYRFEISPEAT